MSLALTLQEAADLLRRNVYGLVVVGVVVFVPADLVVALVDPSRGWGDASLRTPLAVLVALPALTLAYGAAIASVAVEPEGAREEPRTPFAALRDSAAVFPALLAASVVVCVGILAGLVLVVVPGLVLLTWWLVYAQAVVIERGGWRAALGRSRELARGAFWQLLAIAVALTLVVVALDYLVWRVAAEIFPDVVGAWLGGVVADTVSVAVSAAVTTAAYWQLTERNRAES